MKPGLARVLFLVGSLVVATLATAAWDEHEPEILTKSRLDHCPAPPEAKSDTPVEPDRDLLLFLYSLSQGLKGRN